MSIRDEIRNMPTEDLTKFRDVSKALVAKHQSHYHLARRELHLRKKALRDAETFLAKLKEEREHE